MLTPLRALRGLLFRTPQFAIRTGLLVLLLGLVHCGGGSESSRMGTVRVRLADAPFPYQHVRTVSIAISSVEVRQAGTSNFYSIMSNARTFDLLTLQGGTTDTMGSASLLTDSYDQIRIRIASVSLGITDGRTFTPAVSDSVQRGFVVAISPPVQVKGNRTTDLVIDFNVSRSFIAQGNATLSSGISGFVFKPSVRIVDLSTVGRITGAVKHNSRTPSINTDDIPIRGLEVFVVQTGATDTASAVTDDSGNYTVFFLPAGTYTVAADTTDSTTAWTVPGVVVTTANPTRQDALATRR